MKQFFFSLAILCTILCGSVSCRHDADNIQPTISGATANTGTNTTSTNNSTANPAGGSWIVSYYINDGDDMSHHLDGYTFAFQSDGVLSVATGIATVSGTWHTENDDSKQKFTITLSAAADPMLAELAEDWTIKTNSATELGLIKTGGHPQELHFTKK